LLIFVVIFTFFLNPERKPDVDKKQKRNQTLVAQISKNPSKNNAYSVQNLAKASIYQVK
jgi:hypothetical protein